ncbi:MAG TPA: hypothetical protein VKP88_03210 [Candidatus Paceibacterota bacterium]|nr:hypothetical protein [Candidatus Paceibacterota bacterium]
MATCVSLVERDRIVERLRSRFQEQLIGNQVSANLHIRELYGSFERNTFTWLVTIPEMDLLCREDSGIGLDRELEALSSNAFTLS